MTTSYRRLTVLVAASAVVAGTLVPAASAAAPQSGSLRSGPSPVAHLHTVLTGSRVELRWTDPTTPSLRNVVVRLRAGGAAPGSPTAGRAVRLSSATARAVRLPGLAAGARYSAAVFTRDAASHWSRAVTTSFTTVPAAAHAAVVQGRITDQQHQPLAGARVSVVLYDGTEIRTSRPTGADGRYRVTAPAGVPLVTVDGTHAVGGDSDELGYAGDSSSVRLDVGTVLTRDFALRAGGAVEGQITDRAEQAVVGVRAYLRPVPGYVPVISDSPILVLTVDGRPAPSTVTRGDGSYALRGVPAGAYLLCVDPTSGAASGALGYVARCNETAVVVRSLRVSEQAPIALDSADLGAVSGVVVGADHRPLGGASVDFEKSDGTFAFTVTDRNGAFEQGGLAPGDYQLCVRADDQLLDRAPTGSAPRCVREVHVIARHTSTRRVVLPRGAAVTGTITTAGGAPVPNAFVFVSGRSAYGFAQSDAHGHWRVAGLLTGSYTACVNTELVGGPHLPTGLLGGCYDNRSSFGVRAGRTRTGIDVTLRAAGAISGTVTDTAGHPVRNAFVLADNQHGESSDFDGSDASGHYTVRGLGGGTYRVCAVTVDPGTQERVKCQPAVAVTVGATTRHVDLVFDAGGSVRAVVHDADGHPVAGVDSVLVSRCDRPYLCQSLRVFDPHHDVEVAGSWTTGPDGSVTFAGLPPGNYAACALAFHGGTANDTPATGYADRCTGTSFDVVVRAGSTTTVEQTLTVGGEVTGTVTDSAGQPLRGAQLGLPGSPAYDVEGTFGFGDDLPAAASTTGADGTFDLRGVRPGTVKLCVHATEAHAEHDNPGGYLGSCLQSLVTVTAGETTDVTTVALALGGAVTGVVSDDDAKPLGGVLVVLYGRRGKIAGIDITGPKGGYVIRRLHQSTYYACFDGGRRASQCYRNVAWDDRKPPPLAAATAFAVTLGEVTTGIDARLGPK